MIYGRQQNNFIMFLDHIWCLYKSIKYQIRLVEFRQDHFKFKMVSMISKDYNYDAKMLSKANDDLSNLICHLYFLADSNPLFNWLLVKIMIQFDRTNKV